MPLPAPRARTAGLLTEPVDGELVVYDQTTDHAHRLNPAAAAVFRHSDGTRGMPELLEIVTRELGVPADEHVVLTALDELQAAGLLEEFEPRAPDARQLSRRHVFERAALAGGVAALTVPLVKSLVAPEPADAQTLPPRR